MSLTDEMSTAMTKGVVEKLPGTLKQTAKGTKKLSQEAKGICLILGKGISFTAKNVMDAVKGVAFISTQDIRFSKRNIDINEFQNNKDVKMVSEAVTAEVMKCFDRHCKQYGVKYSAVHNVQEDNYTIFFEGKKTETIFKVMQDAFKDYAAEIKDKKDMENNDRKGKKVKKEKKPEERQSVKAKLAFFRDRVKERDGAKEKDALEKNHHRSDRER